MKQNEIELQQAGWLSQPRNGNKPALLTEDVNLGKEIQLLKSASFTLLPMSSVPFSN